MNLRFDDPRVKYESTGVKTDDYDAAKMVGIPSFQNYLNSQDSKPAAKDSNPAAIASTPVLLNNHELLPTSISLKPRVSVERKKTDLPSASVSNREPNETPNSTAIVDLTGDSPRPIVDRPIVDLTMDSPRPTKKSKPECIGPDYHGLYKCGECGDIIDFQDEMDDHKCKN